MAKKHFMTMRKREASYGYLFILPWLIGIILFVAAPLLESFLFSIAQVTNTANGFQVDINGYHNDRSLWDNYHHMLFVDATFPQQLMKTARETTAAVAVITLFSLFVAVMLHGRFKGRNVYRAMFFLPVIMTTGVTYLLVQVGMQGEETLSSTSFADSGNAFLFQATSIRDILVRGGVNAGFINFVTSLVNMIFSLISKSGVQILLFLSGLAKIPLSHYEAARIDGANGWEIFWKITFPLISPILFLNIIYTMIDSFITYGMEKFGNVTMYAIQIMGFGKVMKFDYAAAMSWVYTVMIIAFVAVVYVFVARPASKVLE